jgi:DNA recombination protein RmuC
VDRIADDADGGADTPRRAVLKDVETRKQIDVIKDALGRARGRVQSRFDERMRQARRAHRAGRDRMRRGSRPPEKRSAASSKRIESAELEEKPRRTWCGLAEERKPGA